MAQSSWYLRGHQVVPGDPRGQAVPGLHAARADPAGKGEGGAQGNRAPTSPSQLWEHDQDSDTFLGKGDSPPDQGHWSLASMMPPAGAQPKPAPCRGTYIPTRVPLLPRIPLQTRRR